MCKVAYSHTMHISTCQHKVMQHKQIECGASCVVRANRYMVAQFSTLMGSHAFLVATHRNGNDYLYPFLELRYFFQETPQNSLFLICLKTSNCLLTNHASYLHFFMTLHVLGMFVIIIINYVLRQSTLECSMN